MNKAEFAVAFFQFALPICSMLVACIALYTINRSPMIQQMKDEYSHTKLLARVQEIEGDWAAFQKGNDAALGSVVQQIESVSDRLTAHQKRKRYYDGEDARAAGDRSAKQQKQAIDSAADQGIDLDVAGDVAVDAPLLPGLEADAPARGRMTAAEKVELAAIYKKQMRLGKLPVNGARVT